MKISMKTINFQKIVKFNILKITFWDMRLDLTPIIQKAQSFIANSRIPLAMIKMIINDKNNYKKFFYVA